MPGEDNFGEPRRLARTEVTALLATGAGDELCGVSESDTVDFKASMDLDSPRGKRDLAADLAAFANGRGGIIVVGVRTRCDVVWRCEVADQVVGVRRELVTVEAVTAIARDFCYPPIRDVATHYFDVSNGRGARTSVVVISVEPQPATDAPVVVDRIADASGAAMPHAVGWPIRVGDGTAWTPASRIQQLVSTALTLQARQLPDAASEPADEVLARMALLPEWEQWPSIAIQLRPRPAHGNIVDFYGEFRRTANQWIDIRPNGFGLRLLLQPLEPEGATLASGIADRTRLWVTPRGVVTGVALASPEFLGWALNASENPTVIKVSPYPLIEFFAETIRFAYGVVKPALDAFEMWDIDVRAEHLMDRVPAVFVPSGPTPASIVPHHAATTNSVARHFVGTGDWDRDAFEFISNVLGAGFGVGHDSIPFTRDGRVNPEYFE